MKNQLVEKYTQNAIHGSLVFEKERNKYICRNSKIVEQMRDSGQEKTFFDVLFSSTDPLVLHWAAVDAFSANVKLRQALDVLTFLKQNANALTFCQDSALNEKIRSFIKNDSLSVYEKEVAFYEKINDDDLYQKYQEYRKLIAYHFHWLNGTSEKEWPSESMLTKIEALLNEMKNQGKLTTFFKITCEKFTFDAPYRVDLTMNAFFVGKYGYDKKYAVKTLKTVANASPREVIPSLQRLAETCLNELQ